MTITRRRIITIEKRQRITIRQTSRRTFWCEVCAAEVAAATPEQSAAIFDLGLREIYRGVKNGNLHFAGKSEQMRLICINSIREFNQSIEH